MSKKTTETKLEKQAVKKQPTELKDEELDEAQGGKVIHASNAKYESMSMRELID